MTRLSAHWWKRLALLPQTLALRKQLKRTPPKGEPWAVEATLELIDSLDPEDQKVMAYEIGVVRRVIKLARENPKALDSMDIAELHAAFATIRKWGKEEGRAK